VQSLPTPTDLAYWNGRFFLWCLAKRAAWAMSKDLHDWPRETKPVARA
jgi:hypothetical protein